MPVTAGRCGLKTLSRVLDRSPDIRATYNLEPRELEATKRAWFEAYSNPEPYLSLYRRMRDFGAQLKPIHADLDRRLTFLAPALAEDDRVRLLFLTRDPKEFCTTEARDAWPRFEPTPHIDDAARGYWDELPYRAKLAWLWQAVEDAKARLRDVVPETRILELDARGIFDGSAVRPLCRFLGAAEPYVRTMRDYYQRGFWAPSYDDWTDLEKDWFDTIITYA